MSEQSPRRVIVGEVAGAYGVRGWVRVRSFTDPAENVLDYQPWLIETGAGTECRRVTEARRQGRGLVALLEGIDDRDAAAALTHAKISVERRQLPPSDDYYWTDLEGLEVLTRDGRTLGAVDHLLETGANDVLVVRGDRERLIPWLPRQVILEVDLPGGRLVVDWDPEF